MTNGTVSPQIKRIVAHIVQAELVWLTRLRRTDSNHIEQWPELDLVACAAISESNGVAYESFVAKIQQADLDQEVTYRNQSGKQYDTSIRDILTHVALHSQYHRGQVNLMLRQDEKKPVNVDMITYVRELSNP